MQTCINQNNDRTRIMRKLQFRSSFKLFMEFDVFVEREITKPRQIANHQREISE